MNKYLAELIGTFWLVLGGCGSAVLAAAFPDVGIGLLGVSLAFGLTVVTMAYAIGHISGCHLNPAVTIGLWSGGRFSTKDVVPYVIAQVIGGLLAGGVLYVIASGQAGFAPLAIGFGLTLIHLISIPVTNTSVNPARSTGVAMYVGDWAVSQLWLFWVAPIIGAVLGAIIYRVIATKEE
ncbi:aquaporin [Vibrio agarivorans]|uniref:aquaporin n=1 Tax=Vibrio agarivorans TaxID=153622 RepID=UPI0025B45E60|nr:aquaporin [Vibrio agarivorans]MDN3662961.1 aquaporin [Vibrio agarivorans]